MQNYQKFFNYKYDLYLLFYMFISLKNYFTGNELK